jgi:hypothetical protein
MVSQYAMDWTTGVILPVHVFIFAITFRLALGPTIFRAINTGEFSPEGKAGSA